MQNRSQPAAARMRPAASRPRRRRARPFMTIAVLPVDLSSIAAETIARLSGGSKAGFFTAGMSPRYSFHCRSQGTIRLAIWPRRDASMASAASRAMVSTERTVRCHPENVLHRQSISMARGASASTCHEACSPMTLSRGVRARLALCRFATPLASPGPRCRRHRAGFSFMRP